MFINQIILFYIMSEGEKETWNMANATLQRFDFLLKQSSAFAQTGQLLNWKNCLMDIRRNLRPFMDDIEFEKINKKFKELPDDWTSSNGRINPKHFSKANQIFDEIFMEFIMIMKKKGLLMPKTLDSGKAVIDM